MSDEVCIIRILAECLTDMLNYVLLLIYGKRIHLVYVEQILNGGRGSVVSCCTVSIWRCVGLVYMHCRAQQGRTDIYVTPPSYVGLSWLAHSLNFNLIKHIHEIINARVQYYSVPSPNVERLWRLVEAVCWYDASAVPNFCFVTFK